MHTGRPAAANWAVMSSKPSAVIESPMKSTPLGLASAAWHWTYGVWSTVDAAAKAAGARATVAATNRAAITMATKCGLGTRMILWQLSVPWETFRVPDGAPTGARPSGCGNAPGWLPKPKRNGRRDPRRDMAPSTAGPLKRFATALERMRHARQLKE